MGSYDQLSERYLQGRISPEELARLRVLLREEPERQRDLRRRLELHSLLRNFAEVDSVASKKTWRELCFRPAVLATAASLLLGLVGLIVWSHSGLTIETPASPLVATAPLASAPVPPAAAGSAPGTNTPEVTAMSASEDRPKVASDIAAAPANTASREENEPRLAEEKVASPAVVNADTPAPARQPEAPAAAVVAQVEAARSDHPTGSVPAALPEVAKKPVTVAVERVTASGTNQADARSGLSKPLPMDSQTVKSERLVVSDGGHKQTAKARAKATGTKAEKEDFVESFASWMLDQSLIYPKLQLDDAQKTALHAVFAAKSNAIISDYSKGIQAIGECPYTACREQKYRQVAGKDFCARAEASVLLTKPALEEIRKVLKPDQRIRLAELLNGLQSYSSKIRSIMSLADSPNNQGKIDGIYREAVTKLKI